MRKILFGMFTAAAATIVSSAGAQEPAELFNKLDANQDGVVAVDEVPEDKRPLFERLLRMGDANDDKKLSKDELVAALKKSQPMAEAAPGEGRPGAGRPGGAGGAFSAKAIFERFDKNSDGKLSKDEAPERMRENFDRLDSDGDGNVTLAEFEKVAGAFPGGPPARRPEGTPANPRPEGRTEGRGENGPPLVRALDTDGDGEISAEEIAAAAKSLAKLDKNGDGKLTREELGPPPGMREGAGASPRPEGNAGAFAAQFIARLKEADKNGDGKLSKDEAPDSLKEKTFDRMDSNSDGQLDESELKVIVERMRQGAGRLGDRKKE
ncbi:EF-hand domain-containing protein [Anatilimnocola sp. NA78]|uniref:EF-hand domain-containing protein n=1 Tax=Anatilimnocola sp. NA78 TaxID=3415683 RepID=UPI003CE456A7